jgi:hypothetical protein
MYEYSDLQQVRHINSNSNIHKYVLNIDSKKWRALIKNEDCRFFKHNRNILKQLSNTPEVIIKISSWDSDVLKNEYSLSTKLKHINVIEHICYFEFEEDIIHYLCDVENKEDIQEHNAVIISKYYTRSTFEDVVLSSKQIILFLYTALFVHNLSFTRLNIENIHVEELSKSKKLCYTINAKYYEIRTDRIIKLDILSDAVKLERAPSYTEFNQLYKNLLTILQGNDNMIDFISSLIQVNNYHPINPTKILDTVLSYLDVLV